MLWTAGTKLLLQGHKEKALDGRWRIRVKLINGNFISPTWLSLALAQSITEQNNTDQLILHC